MSAQDAISDPSNEEYVDDSEIGDRSYKLLKLEYEKCRQEVHELKRKLQLNGAMLREVQEANESLERALDRRHSDKEQLLNEIEEKHRRLANDYENVIISLETKLAKQAEEMEEWRKRATENARVIHDRISSADRNSLDSTLQADNVALRDRVDELLSVQREDRKRIETADETIDALKNRCDQLEKYTHGIKEQLDEKNQALEDARAEIALMRAEATSQEIESARESHKGNSLFAEVEDRRQNAVNKMNVLYEKYAELKRAYKSQIAKIKILRAEHIATLRKWESDTGDVLSENEELLQRYKNRISDLESKLKSEIRKNGNTDQSNSADASFGYFQSLLDTKKKEIDQLRIKVEDLSTKLLVQEETKINIAKELQYWRYKASSLEAQVSMLQAESKLDLIDDAERKVSNELEPSVDGEQPSGDTATLVLSNCTPEAEEPWNRGGRRLSDEEPPGRGATVKFKLSTPEARNERVNEQPCLMDDTTAEKGSDSQTSTPACKYPVVYIAIDRNDTEQ